MFDDWDISLLDIGGAAPASSPRTSSPPRPAAGTPADTNVGKAKKEKPKRIYTKKFISCMLCTTEAEVHENGNCCEACHVNVGTVESQLPKIHKKTYMAMKHDADKADWRTFVHQWVEIVGPLRGRGISRAGGKMDFGRWFKEYESKKEWKSGKQGRYMTNTAMCKFYLDGKRLEERKI